MWQDHTTRYLWEEKKVASLNIGMILLRHATELNGLSDGMEGARRRNLAVAG